MVDAKGSLCILYGVLDLPSPLCSRRDYLVSWFRESQCFLKLLSKKPIWGGMPFFRWAIGRDAVSSISPTCSQNMSMLEEGAAGSIWENSLPRSETLILSMRHGVHFILKQKTAYEM